MKTTEVILNPAEFGYYFMLRCYKTSRQTTFTQEDIKYLLSQFFNAMKNYDYKFFDEKLNEINDDNREQFIEDFSSEIIDVFSTKVPTTSKYFFNKYNITQMKMSYENRSTGFEYAIVDFETLCVYNAFFRKSIYNVYEKGYKRDVEEIEIKIDTEEMAFDA